MVSPGVCGALNTAVNKMTQDSVMSLVKFYLYCRHLLQFFGGENGFNVIRELNVVHTLRVLEGTISGSSNNEKR